MVRRSRLLRGKRFSIRKRLIGAGKAVAGLGLFYAVGFSRAGIPTGLHTYSDAEISDMKKYDAAIRARLVEGWSFKGKGFEDDHYLKKDGLEIRRSPYTIRVTYAGEQLYRKEFKDRLGSTRDAARILQDKALLKSWFEKGEVFS